MSYRIIMASDIDMRETAAIFATPSRWALELSPCGIAGAFEDSGAQERVGLFQVSGRS
jgi:hypothetical protein